MRVLFVVDGDVRDPAARVRAYDLVPALSALGVEARVLSARERTGARGKRRLLRAAAWADVVVLQRVLPPGPLLAVLARLHPALVFDFDDALHRLPGVRRRLRAMLGLAVEVVAGSEQLARSVRQVARSVTVIPTVVEPRAYTLATGSSGAGPARVGWIGTTGNLPSLELVRPALGELVERGRGLDIRVISGSAPRWPELPVTPVRWTPDDAASALAELDIGVAPLPDTPWARGKCGLKAIEYMAAGLPVVASPVGALGEIVVHGETGLLAARDRDWVEHLDRLVLDAALRRRMGLAGRRRVEERYCARLAAGALLGVLERASATVRRSAA